jgi:predicted DNA-binding transcriptional regulator YafY
MSRTARLLELLVRVQTRPRFTAAELAEEFGVSRRTMLRDLATLSEMGVPLRSTPGPGGGYSLPRGGRRLSPQLTVDEALGLIVSYESFLRYSESPFSSQSLSAVTKLRAALSPDVVAELDLLRRHVAVVEPVRYYEAPLLGELLDAALAGAHLKVVYDSRSGVSERVVYPFGLYASQGYWYCACHDHSRGHKVSMRADRFLSAERVEGFDRPSHAPLSEWLYRPPQVPLSEWSGDAEGGGESLKMRALVSERGTKSFELDSLFGRIQTKQSGGGVVEVDIPRSEIDFYAASLLSVGTEVRVQSPPELVEAIHRKAREIVGLYS